MSLVATEPLWAPAGATLRSAPQPERAQVLIVGAGLAGSALALFLAEAGWEPVVLEAGPAPGQRISGRDTGLMMPVLNDTPHRLIAALGVDGARGVVDFSKASIELATALGLSSGEGALMAAGIPQEVQQHGADRDALIALDIHADAWTPEQVAEASGCEGFGPGLWLSAGKRLVHDAASQLSLRAEAAGAQFVFDCTVTGLGGSGSDTEVLTRFGPIAADLIILACGHHLPQIEPWFQDKTYPVRTQLLATRPTAEPLLFPIRSQLGHAHIIPGPENQLIASGCRWATPHLEAGETDDTVVSEAVHSKLSQLLKRHRPDAPPIDHQWSAIMTHTCDGLPLLGPIPGQSRVVCCGGFAGHQATLGLGAARAVADGLLDEDHLSVPDLFSLARFV